MRTRRFRLFTAALCIAAAAALALTSAAETPSPPRASSTPAQSVQDDGRKILYNNSEVQHIFVFDKENASYHPVEGLADRLQIIYAAAARKTTEGAGQVLIHTEDGRNVLNFDPAQDPMLEELCEKARREGPHIMQWMAWMDDKNLIRFSTIIDPDGLRQIAYALKTLEVKPTPSIGRGLVNPTTAMGGFLYKMDFSTGTTFELVGCNTDINLSSSTTGDLSIGYQAADQAQMDAFRALIKKLWEAQEKAPVPKEIVPIMPPDSSGVRRVNLYDTERKLYVSSEASLREFNSLLSSAKVLTGPLGKPLTGVSALDVTRKSDLKKFTYRLYENGFTVEGTAVEGQTVAAAYTLGSPALWKLFCTSVQKRFDADKSPHVHWLGLMSDEKIDSVMVRDNAAGTGQFYCADDPAVELLRRITVKPGFTSFAPNQLDKNDPAVVNVEVFFNNGIRYDVNVGKDTLQITSSDVSYGLQYQLIGTKWMEQLRHYAAATMVDPVTGKPVIYLYPEKPTDVSVRLDFDGTLSYTYPAYNGGWEVKAQPDGTLVNKADGSTHYYLFWEGTARERWEHERGFVVKGSETEAFLREKLAFLGLTPREYNDFLTYWVPRMQGNPYNLISFSGEEYGEIAKLTVSPAPDSVLRVHMVWKRLEAPVRIEPQELAPFERTGFAVVEWGGTEVSY